MLTRIPPLAALGPFAALPAHPDPWGRGARPDRVVSPEALRVAGPPVLRPAPSLPSPVSGACLDACAPRRSEIVCAEDATCTCPLSGHLSDADRTLVDDIARQASRLATVLAWVFAVVALTCLVLLMLR